ncbi:reticulon-like protein B9 [Mangifera indica]|uniref:reticulon-like protein B9 n=1 Tax=Mangifera indica TaxID=29780 RepID=UPI001CFBA81F|nr:reticulon-like protein B9 [Mangifera indica]
MPQQQPVRLFGRQRSVHAILGGGKVADILLWNNKTVAAWLLIGMTLLWFIFEVMGYTLVTLLCHICIATLPVVFIWCRILMYIGHRSFLAETIVSESTLREVVSSLSTTLNQAASTFCQTLNKVLMELINLAYGKDQVQFIVVCLVIGTSPMLIFLGIVCLYILSLIGNHFSFLNLLYFGLLCSETLPFLYDRYEDSVDYFADKGIHGLKKLFIKMLDLKKALSRVPMTKND